MAPKKVHFTPRCIDPYPACGVYKNRDVRACTSQNKNDVTCKACLRLDLEGMCYTAEIIDIFAITDGL